jgi:hypothetical protein
MANAPMLAAAKLCTHFQEEHFCPLYQGGGNRGKPSSTKKGVTLLVGPQKCKDIVLTGMQYAQ